MPFRDLLKKKDKIDERTDPSTQPQQQQQPSLQPPPEFKIVRSDTHTEEIIDPPSFPNSPLESPLPNTHSPPSPQRSISRFRSISRSSDKDGSPQRDHKRLSERLHLKRTSSSNSTNLPSNLPDIQDAYNERGDQQEKEAQWEQRATILASAGKSPGAATLPSATDINISQLSVNDSVGRPRSISDAQSDVNIQEAIRLHEAGQLEDATRMFKQLADGGNVLSEVLYGLSLRHGWGCPKDEARAFTHLSAAASNSAVLEAEALKAGLKKGGAAKGELVLAIFELGNCYRYGWGVAIDKPAARQYYETAANLGDTDAMNEAAWCYLEGFGGKKDRFKAAQLLRLAEKNGSKILGNSWIWKDKYNPV